MVLAFMLVVLLGLVDLGASLYLFGMGGDIPTLLAWVLLVKGGMSLLAWHGG